MKFCDKLAKLRKNNNLSQEQLADKLGVSRQAVSKWESGSSYPDMDKIINMCKILNCNLDDLLEDGIIESKPKDNKINFNTYFNDFLNFITKSYNMFWSMKLKEKIKCLFELCIIFIILFLSGTIIYFLVDDLIFDNFLGILGVNFIVERLINPIFLVALIVIGLIIFLHLFKIRYLDYFITIEDKDAREKSTEKALEDEKIIDNKKYIIENPKEKIVIRDPKHSTFNFFNMLGKILLYIIKFFTIIFIIPFIMFTVILISCGAVSAVFIKYSSLFIFMLLAIIGLILICFIIIYFVYNFIFNREIKFKIILVIFISSLLLLGIGSGISITKIMNYEYKEVDESYIEVKEESINMQDNIILYGENINYIIDNEQSNIKLEICYPKGFDYLFYYNIIDEYKIYHIYPSDISTFDAYKIILNSLKENKIINYQDSFKVNVYISQKNYDIIEYNLENYD